MRFYLLWYRVTLSFVSVETLDVAPHHFRAIEAQTYDEFLAGVATEYVQLRTQCLTPLTDISFDGIQVLDVEGIRKRLAAATIPKHQPNSNFDIIRSDFGETLCYMLQEQEYGTKFVHKPVSSRETIDMPGRGIDAVGIEDGNPLTIVLSEVKVSDETASPPQVVDRSSDCLRKQHLAHISDAETTARKLWDLARNILDTKIRDLVVLAATHMEFGAWDQLRLVACCVLVRPRHKYNSKDFGSFRRKPKDYMPANIRFLVVCVPGDINEVVQKWYSFVKPTENSV